MHGYVTFCVDRMSRTTAHTFIVLFDTNRDVDRNIQIYRFNRTKHFKRQKKKQPNKTSTSYSIVSINGVFFVFVQLKAYFLFCCLIQTYIRFVYSDVCFGFCLLASQPYTNVLISHSTHSFYSFIYMYIYILFSFLVRSFRIKKKNKLLLLLLLLLLYNRVVWLYLTCLL